MDGQQIIRIKKMEQAMNDCARAIKMLFAALEQYQAVMPNIAELEEYYKGPLWMCDYDDDNAGRLPKTLCRGVLTEDMLYDLLCDNDMLLEKLSNFCKQK